MKIRQGFVSNSSSSSFTFIGYMVDSKHYGEDFYEEIDEIASSEGFECLFGGDDGLPEHEIAVGALYTMDVECCDTLIDDLEFILKDVRKVPEHIKTKGNILFITGIRAS